MSTSTHSLEKELFLDALELPEEDRDAFLRARCGDDERLFRTVSALVERDAGAPGSFLAGTRTWAGPVPGETWHGFAILRLIGEGGMGSVFEATQSLPRRRVALKVLRDDRFTPSLARRMLREAEILATLQHHGIAQVYEAGVARTEGGRELPFFSMELVRGLPLARFVEEHDSSREERLELIARVCDAVHHAHQRGVIHRDLKSENILVSEEHDTDETSPDEARTIGRPKVLDFGIARLLANDPGTLRTRAGDLIGTLAHMSPEQVAGDSDSVDVRSDVYALGVLLYQVLTGELPLRLSNDNVPRAVERIRHEEPRRLSQVDPRLRGDLEVLVANALHKDPERRIQSAAALAADLRRHMRGEPIEARRDSLLYVVRKTLRRRWPFALSGAIALSALVVVAVVSSVQSRRNARLNRELEEQLEVASVERGRQYAEQGDVEQAEGLLWPQLFRTPESAYARWALCELYSRSPCIGTWRTHDGFIGEVAFDPRGDYIASSGFDGRIVFVRPGEKPETVLELGVVSRTLAFSPLGDLLAVGTDDGRARLFRLPSMEELPSLDAGEGNVMNLRFHPDGRLFTGTRSSALRVFDPASGVLLHELAGHARSVERIVFSRDGTSIATSGDDPFVLVWSDGSPPTVARRIDVDHGVTEALAFSADGRLLATGGRDKTARVFDLGTGEQTQHLVASNGFVEDARFDPEDSDVLITGGWWATLFWNTKTGELVRRINLGAQTLDVHAERKLLALHTGEVTRCITRSSDGVETLGGSTGKTICEATRSGERIATADERGIVRLWSAHDATLEGELSRGSTRVRSLSFDANGERIAFGNETNRAWVVELDSGRDLLVVEEHLDGSGASVALSPDGTLLAHTAIRGKARVFDVATGALRTEVQVDTSQAIGVAFHPDGKRFATTARATNVACIWDLDGTKLAAYPIPGTPWAPAFSGDGTVLAVGSWTKAVHVFFLESDRAPLTLADHRAVVWDVAFHPTDPTLLVSSSDDGTAKLWSLAEERRLATFVDYEGWEVLGVTMALGGDALVYSGRDGATIRSLSWFEHYVATNLESQLARHATGDEAAGASTSLRAWARDVLAREWPPVGW